MKAKQYASEYVAKLNHSKTEEEINHITVGLLVQLMKELNQKWNAIADLVEKEMGMTVLVPNAYRDLLFLKIPGMKEAWRK